MKVFLIAAVAVAVSGAAFAKDIKKQDSAAPAVKATVMSDSEMDKITAGSINFCSGTGCGVATAPTGNVTHSGDGLARASSNSGLCVGVGTATHC